MNDPTADFSKEKFRALISFLFLDLVSFGFLDL